jgi:tetratricopeptide (TPR) repeat protein
MGLLTILILFGLLWALREFGRNGVIISFLVTLVCSCGATYGYWSLGAYEMSLSTEALNALPENERAYVIAQAAEDEFLERNRVANQEIINLFQLALDIDPNQITALGSMGIIAFEAGEYEKTVLFWTRMLEQLPPESDQANLISTGIARASERANALASQENIVVESIIQLDVSLDQELPDNLKEASVFIFARELDGSPRPLAAKRLSVKDLPVSITLSNQDALMGGKLSQGLEVEVAARLTVSDASGTESDWMAVPIIMTLGSKNIGSLRLKP